MSNFRHSLQNKIRNHKTRKSNGNSLAKDNNEEVLIEEIKKTDDITPVNWYARYSPFPSSSIFSNSEFIKLWGAQISSQVAINLLFFILAVEIYNQTHSNQAVSYLMLSFGLASFLFGAFAGVFVDHTNKRNIMLLSNLARFGLTLLVIFFTKSFWATIIIVFLLNSATQFFLPAEASAMPKIVKDKNLLTANSLFTLSLYASKMSGYVFGGFLLNTYGLTASIITIAVLFFIASVFNAALKVPDDIIKRMPIKDMVSSVISELKDGLVYIKTHDEVKDPLIYMSGSMVVVGVFFTLLPGYAVNILGIKPEDTSFYLIAPLAGGMIIGAILINFLKKHISLDKITSIGIFTVAITLVLTALNRRIPFDAIKDITTDKINPATSQEIHNAINHLPNKINKVFGIDVLLFAIIFMVILGISNAFIVIVNNTLLQKNTNKDMRGRVYGVLQTIVTALAAIPVIISGYLADHYGVGKVLIGIAAFVLLFHLLVRISSKKSLF